MAQNADFWKARWRANQIGFHQRAVSPFLAENYARFAPAAGSRVLVPLCGKSLDLLWLAERGHDVVGVELSELAAEQFAAEHGPQARVQILVRDVFALRPKELGLFPWIFDRAALVAFDPETQVRYAQHAVSFLEPNGRIFLITDEYDDTKMNGPPFSVPEARVRALYPSARSIERVVDRDCLEPRFIERGLSAMREAFYAISF